MANAEHTDTLSVQKSKLFAAITKYEDYPQFVDGVSSVKVERQGPGKARATYNISIMGQNMTYTLDHVEDEAAGNVQWTLVDSNFFKKNTGGWKIVESSSAQCKVTYTLDVDFKISVPSFILNRLVKGSLPTMVKGFEKRAKSL
jgi:ribosome-associated toxin RatA of RatAB toxin-antitoxin module